MDKLIWPFLFSSIIAAVFTPLTIYIAKKLNLVDNPKTRPHPAHVQNRIVPRAGGLPVFIAIFLCILLFIPFDKHILGILLGSFILLVLGLLDDYLKDFSPYPRLLLQFVAAGVVVASGVGITFITNPFGGILRLDQWVIPLELFGSHNILIIADILAFIWIIWMMNCVNWSKGVDGQMPGIILVSSTTIGFLSYKLFLQGDLNQLHIAQMAFITAGASLGLLFFNWYPAKIFPGFSASTVLGFMVATLAILSGAKLATAGLVLLIPAIDFFYTFFRRIVSGKSPFFGDQKHLHHLLLKRGWSHQQISLFYIFTCAILGLLATNLSSQGKLFTVIGLSIVSLGAIIWLHAFQIKEKDE